MLLQLYGINQKDSECQYFIKLEKPYFGPILAPFDLKTSKQDFPTKDHLDQL